MFLRGAALQFYICSYAETGTGAIFGRGSHTAPWVQGK